MSTIPNLSSVTTRDSSNDRALRTVVTDGNISASFEPSGLRNGGLHTLVTVTDAAWTALPATALTDRNAIAIQNNSNFEIKVNYSAAIVGYQGMTVRAGEERTYDIKDTIVIYARAESGAGSVDIDVEEIS